MEDIELKRKFKSKYSFKKEIRRKIEIEAFKYLNNKKVQHSKLDNLKFNKIKCANYLTDPRISKREAKLLFKLRTRMYSVKSNFKNMYKLNLICDLSLYNVHLQSFSFYPMLLVLNI